MITTTLSYAFKGGQFEENIKELRGQMVDVCGESCESGVTILEGGTHRGMKYCHFLHLGGSDTTHPPPTPAGLPAWSITHSKGLGRV